MVDSSVVKNHRFMVMTIFVGIFLCCQTERQYINAIGFLHRMLKSLTALQEQDYI
jgi:hypothetical protein